MKPNLFSIFGIDVPAYFGMLATGLALATWIGSRWVSRLGRDREVIIDLGLAATIWGVIGSRILHVFADGYFWDYVHACTDPSLVDWHITLEQCRSSAFDGTWDAARSVCHPKERNCFAWAAFWAGGLTYYGGLIAATVYAWFFLRREKFPFFKAADMAGFAIPLGLAWGRMGCFLAGCCFGRVCHQPWAAEFPRWSPAWDLHLRDHRIERAATHALSVHPTQLYEAIGSLVIAVLAYAYVAPRKRFDGQVFVFFVAAYGVLRFVLEFLREDDRGGVLGVSTSQWISIALIAAALGSVRWLKQLSATRELTSLR
ncbi:MAG: prolipoprotein diacylglyceryl transferase [Deltaproteobacteria bacterium]|nr:prolipoprotein diacylglyceryl transferase [Deltaproteobacteria bacterium]